MGSDNEVVIVLVNHEFKDEEFNATKEALSAAGIGVKITALAPGECLGTNGTAVTADFAIDGVDTSQYAGVVFIGGVGVEQYLHDESVQGLAKSFAAGGKVVAAICWASSILANAGLLSGKKATAWDGAKEDLIKGGAEYTGEQVTVDGNIVTANGPDAAAAFGQKIAEMIIG